MNHTIEQLEIEAGKYKEACLLADRYGCKDLASEFYRRYVGQKERARKLRHKRA